MHKTVIRFYVGLCIVLFLQIPNAKASGQIAEIPSASSEFSDPVDMSEELEPVSPPPMPEVDSEAIYRESHPAMLTGPSREPDSGQKIVFSGLKEVVAPSMKLLSNANQLTDPKNCGVRRSPCLLVFGDMDSEFYAIKQRTFARHAAGPLPGTDFGDRGVNNMLAANFLEERVLYRPHIIQLGETGVDYWIIPKCGAYVRFTKRISVKQFPDHAEPIQLRC